MKFSFSLRLLAALATLASPCVAAAEPFRLTSPDLEEGGSLSATHVLNGFGCAGDNLSPALTWSGAPAATRSFAVTVYDPDAPTGSGWWHWVVFNLPPETNGLPAGAAQDTLPEGAIESRTDFGTPGYGGPCPPEGAAPHHYVFSVHALGVETLPLDDDAPAAMVGYYLNANTLETATLTATYAR